MTELDPRIQAAIGRSQASHSPPVGGEDRMLAQFHARLEGPPDGPPDSGPDGGGVGSSVAAGGQLVHALKIVAAVVGLTAAGLGGVSLVAKAVRGDEVRDHARVDADVEAEPPAQLEVRPEAKPEARPAPTATDAEPGVQAEPPEPAPAPSGSPLVKASPAPVAQASAGSSATLGAELQLIRAARNAPALQALEQIERHAEQFPEGELSNEREGLRVIALCELGRLEQARRAGEQFVARAPGPLLIQRVRTGCGEKISLPTTGSKAAGNRSF